ncbi:MAG: hypothetical protein BWX48_02568 [Verrucomicrobia bacterium ADurb.Bin006]|jgi:hypothetical protein|nr:MAG: hypothetical protein BWX48_02568 [Verrucomicrobia bacterium ADurb.Bin006]
MPLRVFLGERERRLGIGALPDPMSQCGGKEGAGVA